MDISSDALIFAIVQVFMLVGLFGLIVPVFPGIVVMWLSVLGYAILTGWGSLGVLFFVIITLLMVVGEVVDNLMMAGGARRGGASWLSIGLALVAGIFGTLLFPPVGGVIAAPLAVLLLEYSRARDWQKATQALRGLATGWGLSFVIRFVIGLVIMGLWWAWVFLRA